MRASACLFVLFYAKMSLSASFFLLIAVRVLETFASFVIGRKTISKNLSTFKNHEKRLLYLIIGALHERTYESRRLDETSA